MSLNATPSSERIHIGFFGMRNAGKSSLVNAVTGQELAVVSDVAGTTTDPVKKAMELLPLGPVVVIDTPGLDDEGLLGELRVQKTKNILKDVNIAVVVVDALRGMQEPDAGLLKLLKENNTPYVLVYNKTDALGSFEAETVKQGTLAEDALQEKGFTEAELAALQKKIIWVSAATGQGVNQLKEALATLGQSGKSERYIVADIVAPGDVVVLVIPIDEAAPKGRLILPQQQTLRELLDIGAVGVVCKDTELKETLNKLADKPKLVITDSQAFGKVSAIVPKDILLTSFSILFARYKGNLNVLVKGAEVLNSLEDNDKILMAEGCTHHRQCGDIGSVKLPAWIRKYTGKELIFEFVSGGDFPDDLKEYALVVHCGGCTLTEQVMQRRLRTCEEAGIPITNYGMAIAHMNGILERSMEPFKRG